MAQQQPFPHRVFLQTFDEKSRALPPDYQCVANAIAEKNATNQTKQRNDGGEATTASVIEVQSFLEEELEKLNITKNDLVVGNFNCTRKALQLLGVPMPEAPDYPQCLHHLLHRNVWLSTLHEISELLKKDPSSLGSSNPTFIKPAVDAKIFSAIIEPKDQMLESILHGIPGVMDGLDPNTKVWCAECIEMVAEYRVYVVGGEVAAVAPYKTRIGEDASPALKAAVEKGIDMQVVRGAVETLRAEDPALCSGCSIDFALARKKRRAEDDGGQEEEEVSFPTVLIEVNDGYSLGRYDGVSGQDYTMLLVERWKSIVQ